MPRKGRLLKGSPGGASHPVVHTVPALPQRVVRLLDPLRSTARPAPNSRASRTTALICALASARAPERLAELLPFATLRLTDDEVAKLNAASA